jgi:hypothetical protein
LLVQDQHLNWIERADYPSFSGAAPTVVPLRGLRLATGCNSEQPINRTRLEFVKNAIGVLAA